MPSFSPLSVEPLGGSSLAIGQASKVATEVLLTPAAPNAQASRFAVEVLMSVNPVLQVGNVFMETMMTPQATLQVSGVFGEVLRSTQVWTPLGYPNKPKTYKIR